MKYMQVNLNYKTARTIYTINSTISKMSEIFGPTIHTLFSAGYVDWSQLYSMYKQKVEETYSYFSNVEKKHIFRFIHHLIWNYNSQDFKWRPHVCLEKKNFRLRDRFLSLAFGPIDINSLKHVRLLIEAVQVKRTDKKTNLTMVEVNFIEFSIKR